MSESPYQHRLFRLAAAGGIVLASMTGLFCLLMPYQARTGALHLFNRSGAGVLGRGTVAESAGVHLAKGFSEIARTHGGVRFEIIETSNPQETLDAMTSGKAQFGVIPGILALREAGILGLTPLRREYAHVVVPADGPVKTFRDLAGKRVGIGTPGSVSSLLSQILFGYFNFAETSELVLDHSPDLEKEFLAGTLDAAITVYPLFSPEIERLLSTGWYRLIPVPEAEALSRYRPGLFAESLPGNLYGPDRQLPPGDAAFPAVAIDWNLVARADASPALAMALLDAAHHPGFAQGLPSETENRLSTGQSSGLPPHPAVALYETRSEGLTREEFEAGAFFIMGLVLLVLLGQYGSYRIRLALIRRQRQRILPFFERMREIGLAIANSEHPHEVQTFLQELMSLHRRAEKAWLMGRFDSDDFKNLCAIYGIYNHAASHKMRSETREYFHTSPLPVREEASHTAAETMYSREPVPEPATGRGWPFDITRDEEEEDPDQMTLF